MNHRARKRRPASRPLTLGVTGSMAMGKSTAAVFLRHLGIQVFDADAVVHKLLGPQGAALAPLARRFPDLVGPAGVDRAKMGALVFADRTALADLEAILHPLVHEARARFIRRAAVGRAPMVALDVPLLFEGKGRQDYDLVAVVSAPAFLQKQRALRRPGMTAEKFAGALGRQMPDVRKRALADVVIPTGLGKRETLRRLQRLLKLAKAEKRNSNA
jgi:dephospho-CoA kinase